MASDLKKKTLSGMIWSFVQRFGTMAISFVSNIVLARLLTPDDYGTIGMLMIFIAVANTFVDGGFGSALIQKKEPTQEDYSTIFWWNMFLSIVLYGLLYLGAPAIARFYNLPLLCDVLRVQGIVLIINALSIIQQNQLRKQLKFKRLATVTVISAILSAGAAIILAYIGWGVWALVAQQLMLSGFTAIQLWVLNKWYPLLIFSKESFKQLFGFGGFILASNIINTFCNEFQSLLIGKFFPPSTLGYFTQAKKLDSVISNSIAGVVDQVSYPILSEYQHDNRAMIRTIQRLLESLAYLTIPLMLIMILIAEPIIEIVYGEQWMQCVPYFQIYCLAGIAISLQGVPYYAVASKGKSKELFRWTIIKRLFSIASVIIGFIYFEMYGILFGIVLSAWGIFIANAYLVHKYIGYTMGQQLKDLTPIIILNVVSALICLFIKNHIYYNIYIELLIILVIYICIYSFVSIICKLAPYKYIAETIYSKVKK